MTTTTMATNEGSSLILQYYPVAEVNFVQKVYTPMNSLVFAQGKFSGVLKRRLTLEGLHDFHEPRDRLSPST
ncbi:uncharacterized protein ARMOST_12314 [Armillaria ostoyae]|uniref:Uncharacterized protein n=1 Tax=Armillaria ostoyae TaxID=47428 RepID=A0A284RJJ5_ARMOS|nr:uncharacterized protein ARMOST_12314 [Armillaria ostoyae]